MIYFIRAGLSGPVKIGKADNIDDRLAALQTAHYEVLSVIRAIDGSYPQESWLRRRFADFWIRGEWHHFSPDMLTIEVPADTMTQPVGVSAILRDGPTPSTLIDRLGGTGAVARIAGSSASRISNWRRFGIPSNVFGPLVRASSGRVSYADLETQNIPERNESAA